MVPTVSVLLKIAKGLGCRPEELIRDRLDAAPTPAGTPAGTLAEKEGSNGAGNGRVLSETQLIGATSSLPAPTGMHVWKLDLSTDRGLPAIELDAGQRAILLVESGSVKIEAGDRELEMRAGDCIEVEGGRLRSAAPQPRPARLTLIVSPPGDLDLQPESPSPGSSADLGLPG